MTSPNLSEEQVIEIGQAAHDAVWKTPFWQTYGLHGEARAKYSHLNNVKLGQNTVLLLREAGYDVVPRVSGS